MKKHNLIVTACVIFSFILIEGCRNRTNDKNLMLTVLNNIEQIKSSTYLSSLSGSAPGDTTKFVTYDWYKVEYFNPIDTFIGSTFAWFQPKDTSKMYYFYDGSAQGYIDEDIKTIEIDSFKTNSLPFRPIGPPFFNYVRSILKYALETNDSISKSIQHYEDSLLFTLTIYSDKQVEFFGNPTYIKNPYNSGDEISRYDIWINKSNYLPYKYRRRMSTNTSWETCKNVRYNNADIKSFSSQVYFPTDYKISVRGEEKPLIDNLTGTAAPNWTLSDSDNNFISLNDLKSKVLLIQFTGIGCGPCHASIPFLKQLTIDYKNKSFELLGIETWSNNFDGIKKYCLNNDINYKFLLSTKEITNNYQIQGVPVFFILDENRIIRKMVRGYEKDTTDKEIKEVIERLI